MPPSYSLAVEVIKNHLCHHHHMVLVRPSTEQVLSAFQYVCTYDVQEWSNRGQQAVLLRPLSSHVVVWSVYPVPGTIYQYQVPWSNTRYRY